MASDAWMSMLERCFLNPGFWKYGKRRPTLFGRCVTRSLQRLQVHPESHFQCGRYCYALPYACVPECTCYIGPNSQIPRGRPSLLYDHTNAMLRVVV